MSNIFDSITLFIFDLDGVVYEGTNVIPGALELLQKLRDAGKIIYALTNNSTLTREMYKKKLDKIGIDIPLQKIMTSGFATAQYLSEHGAIGKTAFVVGEIGLKMELQNVNITPVNLHKSSKLPPSVDYVVVGLDRNFTYQKISSALTYLLNGADFIASNDDPNLPTDKGLQPGAGVMVSAISTCSGKKPSATIGKPNPISISEILKRENISKESAVIIGDRFVTDISAGINAGIKTIMVKTGAGKLEKDIALNAEIKPHLIADSIADLLDLL
ncbi:MAG: HAD-IIA family hydrolase [Candidatus Lokiarchaeota archaeon]|nr:HAD-IIA family hydrolase [Candidatus Lokiarchaeota archaeon]